MRVVLDTGIFISFLINSEGYPSKAINLWLDKEFELISSEWQLNELKRVTRYAHIQKLIHPQEAGRIINTLQKRATILKDIPDVTYSPDPDDNPIIATAIAGKAFYLVSGDKKDLVKLERIEGIEILTVRGFVENFA